MRLTVGFDATAAVRQTAGIGRYARQLLAALASRDDETEYRVFASAGGETLGRMPALDRRFRYRPIPLSDRITNALWHRLHLPIPVQLFTGRFDLFHSPDFTLPPVMGRPAVLTVHDLAFLAVPDAAYPTLRAYLERAVPASVRRANRIIAVSEATRRDLIERLGVAEDKITAIAEGVGSEFHPLSNGDAACSTLARYGIEGPFILSVGTVQPRKNYARLLEAYSLLRARGVEHRLVIAGSPGWLYEPVLARLSELSLRPHVSIIQPDDADLAALYGAADLFVLPSIYEGFGIPMLEAMACATAVACSSTSSLPEVAGDAALYFDPYDVEEMAACMLRLLDERELRKDLVARGLKRAAQFSWERAADRTVSVYREVACSG